MMKKILVVDDEENICKLYKEELEEMGFEVTTVMDGSSALAAIYVQISGSRGYWVLKPRMARYSP